MDKVNGQRNLTCAAEKRQLIPLYECPDQQHTCRCCKNERWIRWKESQVGILGRMCPQGIFDV